MKLSSKHEIKASNREEKKILFLATFVNSVV